MNHPYLPSENLLQALTVAQKLNRPLLLTGEPGTGKTKFADYVRNEKIGLDYSKLEKFYTKSTSLSQDIFYDFDSIGYFASKQLDKDNHKPITAFVYLNALGKAVCNAIGKDRVTGILKESQQYIKTADDKKQEFLDAFIKQLSLSSINTIVLIDEIDKAPRDFPNDILNEIDEGYKFKIKELDIEFALSNEDRNKVLIIITSNFEKNLPEPFLRRCVYCNINFPSDIELLKIVCARFFDAEYNIIKAKVSLTDTNDLKNENIELIKVRLKEIDDLRNKNLLKKPSTSEIIDFFECIKDSDLKQSIVSNPYISTLVKRKEDLSKI
jgi:MoxR-like ATPase